MGFTSVTNNEKCDHDYDHQLSKHCDTATAEPRMCSLFDLDQFVDERVSDWRGFMDHHSQEPSNI